MWAHEGARLGAGELVINSIDRDGTKAGYDLEITRRISESVSVPVVASGGAGAPEHLRDAFIAGAADAAIVASIVHYGEYPIPELKRYLKGAGVEVRDAIRLRSALDEARDRCFRFQLRCYRADARAGRTPRRSSRSASCGGGARAGRVRHGPGDKKAHPSQRYRRIVLLGAVIKGQTQHDEVITHATAAAALRLAIKHEKPVGLGITGPGMTHEQAMERLDNAKNAVEAVVRMLKTLREIDA